MISPYTYILVENTYCFQKHPFLRYGMAVMDNTSKTILRTVSDLSCDRQPVSDLVALCNRLGLDPEQLDDVVEDFLS